jgi:hypothetical protein
MLFLAVIIIIVSGLIAYIGDLVGRKMGRKRLTLLGLRPRHTAIIISVAMGMLIATLALAMTITVSGTIRESFFTPISQLKAKLGAMQYHVAQANEEIVRTTADADRVKAQFTAETEKLALAERQLAASGRQRRRIKAELAKSRHELTAAQGELGQVQVKLTNIRRRLLFAQAEYRRIQGDLQRSSDRLILKTQELIKLQNDEMRLQQVRDELQGEVAALNERVALLAEFARSSFAPLAFTSGQEIVSGLVPVVTSEREQIAYLTKLMAAAETLVRQRSPEMPKEASPLLYLGGNEAHYQSLDAQDALKGLAKRVTEFSADAPVIICIAPVNNVPVNGPALIAVQTIELAPNTTVYHAGEEIARIELSVTEGTTTADALGRLADDLLRTRVPEALRAKGVLMITRRFDARHPTQAPEASLSRVPWSDLLTAAEQVAAHRGSVAVLAKARTTVTRYGPVDLSFVVVDGGK